MSKILALDLGSTQLKLLVMNERAEVCYTGTESYPTQFPKAGWIEQKPQDWLSAAEAGIHKLSLFISPDEIDVISFSGHMSGVVLVDAAGEALYPCIMLADSRTEEECGYLRETLGELIRNQTGNPVINAFSLPKLLWLKKNETKIYEKAAAWLSAKDYLRYYFTDQMETESTDAYNSLCLPLNSDQWSEDIVRKAGLDISKFPRVRKPFECVGSIKKAAAFKYGFRPGTLVVAGGADMACGALGTGITAEGDAALTLGTCATFLMVLSKIDEESYGKITFHNHAIPGKLYALGSHFNGGLAVNWLSGILSEKGKRDYAMIAELAKEAEKVSPGSNGVLTIPFLAGSGSPYFRAEDRQSILGISAATTRSELFRSELEGVTYNLKQTLNLYEEILNKKLRMLSLSGGGTKIDFWPQLISDVFGMEVSVAASPDASAIGAAILGGIGAGIFKDITELSKKCVKISNILHSDLERNKRYQELYHDYIKAYYGLQNIRQESKKNEIS